jgi:hypothetical protein
MSDYDLLDHEPTGRAENVAWSSETEADVENTLILSGRTTPLIVIVAVLAAIVTFLGAVAAGMAMSKSSSPSVATPTTTTVVMTTPTTTQKTSVAPPPPPVTSTTTATTTWIEPPVVIPTVDNTARNEQWFVDAVRNYHPPSAILPYSHDTTDAQLVTFGNQACNAMDRYPNNKSRARYALYENSGFNVPLLISQFNRESLDFMTFSAAFLCPNHNSDPQTG